MKTLVIAAGLIAGLAAPALAQSQLERAVGAAPGQYSIGELSDLAPISPDTQAVAV